MTVLRINKNIGDILFLFLYLTNVKNEFVYSTLQNKKYLKNRSKTTLSKFVCKREVASGS